MYAGQFVFSQIMQALPRRAFQSCVRRYGGDRRMRRLSCREQFACMAFAQLTFRESLRDLTVCLNALGGKLYHAGLRGPVARSTLATSCSAESLRSSPTAKRSVAGQARDPSSAAAPTTTCC